MSTIPNKKRIAILGGGTNTYISNHLALSAPAYGTTAKTLFSKFQHHSENQMEVDLYLTDMCTKGRSIENKDKIPLDTPEDVEALVDRLVADPDTRVIIFNVAMVDYKPTSLFSLESNSYDAYNPREITDKFGKYAGRLNTSKLPEVCLELAVQDKIIQKIRKERKDILLVGFKTTCGATKEEQYNKGLKLCKEASANIVFVNDVDKDRIQKLDTLNYEISKTLKLLRTSDSVLKLHLKDRLAEQQDELDSLQNNGLVTPEESSYWYNTRAEALDALVQMVLDRSHLHFTRSTVVDSETVSWNIQVREGVQLNNMGQPLPVLPLGKLIDTPNPIIPETFRTVFDWVRSKGAYKKGPTGATVGHFGIALGPNEFLTSKRKTDFNKIEEVGLVRVITDDPDNVFGYQHFFETENVKVLRQVIKSYEADIYAERQTRNNENVIKMFETKLESAQKALEKERTKVLAFGAKPSVGGQSQRSLFDAYPDLNCIVHFHCPLRTEYRDKFKPVQQFGVECGSHECGQNTAMNMKEFKLPSGKSVWAVHLDHHGPNIIFDSVTSDPQEIIDFIGTHWALDKRTTGLNDELI